jgi:NitT/TauT family transport system substrate-binding protein
MFSAIVISMVVIGGSVWAFTSCNKKDPRNIRVGMLPPDILFAPLYIAYNKGFFSDENLNVSFVQVASSAEAGSMLLAGNLDVSTSWILPPISTVAQGVQDNLKMFSPLHSTLPFHIMSRNPEPNFQLTDLISKELLVGTRTASVSFTIQRILLDAGIPFNETGGAGVVKLNFAYGPDAIPPAFLGSRIGDYAIFGEPPASIAVNEGKAHRVDAVANHIDDFLALGMMARGSYITNNAENLKGFLRALKRAYDFIMESPTAEVATAIGNFLPVQDQTALHSAIEETARRILTDIVPMTEDEYIMTIKLFEQAFQLNGFSGLQIPFSRVITNELFPLEKQGG